MKTMFDTEPCETCDFAPGFCGRDITDCMVNYHHKKGAGVEVYHNSGRMIRNDKGEYMPPFGEVEK